MKSNPTRSVSMSRALSPDRRLVLAGGAASGLLAALPRQAQAQAQAHDAAAFDAALQDVFAAHAPVALGGTVWRGGTKLWDGVVGQRRQGAPDPASRADLWHLGSNTKAMTAALWARLVEQGRVRWDMPLAEAFKAGFADLSLHEGWHDRTVEDFLRHRAGLLDEDWLTPMWLMTGHADTAPLVQQRRALVAKMMTAPPEGAHGAFAYGNANYILVGALMEGLTGQAWEDLMRVEVFAPLGITTGGFGAPVGDQPWGHSGGGTMRSAVDPSGAADNPAALGPAGTVHMSLDDYGRFLCAFTGAGPADWLGTDSLSRLTMPREGQDYALGWIVVKGRPWAKGPLLGHDGSNTMWYASALLDPAAGLALVAVSNDGPTGMKACPALVRRLTGAATGLAV